MPTALKSRTSTPFAAVGGGGRPAAGRWANAALQAFGVFTALAIAGFAVFARHPELLAGRPAAMRVYAVSFTFFPRAHIVIGALALAVLLVSRAGWRWLPAFVSVYALSLSSELLGTTVGLPFGPYRYTDGLGLKWFAHVPVLIPLSWFLMALPSYAIARRLLGHGASPARRVLLGSLILLSWDLALDPAMSQFTSYWVWGSSGPYYGMPWLNLAGWYVTGLVLMLALVVARSDAWIDRLSTAWLALFYMLNLALPLGLILATGAWGALFATAGALVVCGVLGRGGAVRHVAASAARGAEPAARRVAAR